MSNQESREEKEINRLLELSLSQMASDPEKAIITLKGVVSLSQELNIQEKEVLGFSGLALVYSRKGDIKACYDYCRRAIFLGNQLTDKIFLAKVYNNISVIFASWAHHQKAILYVKNAINLVKGHSDLKFQSSLQGNLGMYYFEIDNISEAMKAFEREKVLGEKANSNLQINQFHIGVCHLKLKEYEKAEQLLTIVDGEIEIHGAQLLTRDIYLGQLYNELSKFEKAKKILKSALSLHNKSFEGVQLKHRILKQLSIAYAGLKLYKKAYLAQESYLKLDTDKKWSQMALSYEEEINSFEIKELHTKLSSLETVNAELELFASKAAHDIKEPLRTITSFTNLLSKEMEGKLTFEAQEYIAFINDSTKRLSHMLTDMLNFAVIGQPQKIETIDLSSIIETVEINLETLIQEKDARIMLAENASFQGAQTLMVLLFQNLISNSIKYCVKRPLIEVSVERRKNEVVFSISDNGIGIEKEYLTKIFNPLERLHSQKEYEGTGIGLTSCKKIVKELGGEIGVDSEPGKGSTFWFSLPNQADKEEHELSLNEALC